MAKELTFADALPTGKSKQRKLDVLRDEDEESVVGEEEEDSLLFVQPEPVAVKRVKKAVPKARKSEPVKRVARADSDSAHGEVDEDSQLSVQHEPVAVKRVKKTVPKARKSEPVKRAARVDEYEEDEGRMEGQYVNPDSRPRTMQ